ncbi:MAG: hypothetical protein R2788_08810 [Saprospiraceae bacterium]
MPRTIYVCIDGLLFRQVITGSAWSDRVTLKVQESGIAGFVGRRDRHLNGAPG